MGKIGIVTSSRCENRQTSAWCYVTGRPKNFQDEETAKVRSENEVCIFTHDSSKDSHRLAQMRTPREKASGKDCKGSNGLQKSMNRFSFVRRKFCNAQSRMRGNLHVRFLEGEAAATPPTYSMCDKKSTK